MEAGGQMKNKLPNNTCYKDSKGVGVGQFGGECIRSNLLFLMHNYLEVG